MPDNIYTKKELDEKIKMNSFYEPFYGNIFAFYNSLTKEEIEKIGREKLNHIKQMIEK